MCQMLGLNIIYCDRIPLGHCPPSKSIKVVESPETKICSKCFLSGSHSTVPRSSEVGSEMLASTCYDICQPLASTKT